MWINLFTVSFAIALGCGVVALVLQNEMPVPRDEPKRRRYGQRRLSRVRN